MKGITSMIQLKDNRQVQLVVLGITLFAAALASPDLSAQTLPSIGSGTLQLHLDATTISATDGAAIGQWDDISGNVRHASATGTAQPTFNASAFTPTNGPALAGVQFNGSSHRLDGNFSLVSGYPFTVFAVTQSSNDSGTDTIFSMVDQSAGNVFNGGIRFNGGDAGIYARNVDFEEATSAGGFADGETHIFAGQFTSNTLKELFIDGALEATLTDSVTYNTNIDRYSIGGLGDSSPSDLLEGFVGEVLVYSGNLTADDRQEIESYLNEKWVAGVTNVPEPAAMFMWLVTGLVGLGTARFVMRRVKRESE